MAPMVGSVSLLVCRSTIGLGLSNVQLHHSIHIELVLVGSFPPQLCQCYATTQRESFDIVGFSLIQLALCHCYE